MKKSKKFIIIFIIVLIALVIGLLGQRKTKVENTAMGSSLESVAEIFLVELLPILKIKYIQKFLSFQPYFC
jgi:hypothetical protein